MTRPKQSYTNMGSSLLILLVSASYPTPITSSNISMENAPHRPCPNGLKYHHGGECALGDKDHTLYHPIISADIQWLEELNINGEHCINCHEGWGGVDCSRTYQLCNAEDPEAPVCFNGSQCYKMGINTISGKYDYMCDCTLAGMEEGGDHTKKYAGKFYQHEQELKCGGEGDEMFCTNGGKCVSILDETDWTHEHFECKCPESRGGTHCEFLEEEGFTDCRLECENGTCAKGFKSYDELIGAGAFPAKLAFDIISSGGEHCVCPEGWTGLKCEIPVNKCGSTKYCYNGASCSSDESGRPICDCNSAHTDDISYAGMSCEQEGTAHCEPGFDQDHKDAFCTNHGKCIDDPETRHKGCICEEGWSGDLCDIQGNDKPVCDLACENGGSCRLGVKGYKDKLDNLLLPALAKKHENGMHCSCPENFTGVRCEVDVSHCHLDDGSKAGEADFCLNGVPCAPDNPEMDGVDKKFTCQCDQGTDEISQMLAGRFCEYAVTEYCSKDRARHSHLFCTNGGKCKKENDHDESEHHGCCCLSGFEGEYCQLPQGNLDLKQTSITWSPMYECNHKKSSSQQNGSASEHMTVFPVAPKPSGKWEHITINPKFEVPSNIIEDTEEDEENKEPVLAKVTAPKYEEPQEENSSSIGGIVSGVLVTLLIVGVAGVVYKKRSMKEDPHQFAADWWQGHIGN